MNYAPDSLLYDTAKIAEYQSDTRYDYNSQLQTGVSLMDIFQKWLSHLIQRMFGSLSEETADTVVTYLLIGFFVLTIVFVVYFVWKKHPELFMREKKLSDIPYDIEEENIYGIDFEKELSAALDVGDFRNAMRIVYLQTLRYMADRQWIEWQIFKTPTEYVYELSPKGLRQPFRVFTNYFLQVRYGNYKATAELFEKMAELKRQLWKGEQNER